ncbi:hypothetical protein V6S67_05335 [Arthrobacter sp. Soc17.1.1.1]|jgi:uncharacterized protein YukE|uniref:WXG100 family type VII secretion target n=1 Tax=Arthrobacter sp. Soc17.1.1.1 TaxID=3121277 RepID=UPI002FE473DE
MSNITHGNNPQEMQELATLLTQKSEEINQMVGQLTTKLASTGWEGPDAGRFRSDWEGHRAKLTAIASELGTVSQTVQKNKQDQETASA